LYRSWALWFLGYPEQALQCSTEAIEWAQELVHPFSLAFAWDYAAEVSHLRREARMTQQRAEAAIALCVEQGFPFWAAWGKVMRSWALAEQGKHKEGITAMREGLAAYEATGARMGKTLFLSLLADAYGKAGQPEAGLQSLAEAFDFLDKANERAYEAELHRLKVELSLQLAMKDWRPETGGKTSQKLKGKGPKAKGIGDWELGAGSSSPHAPGLKLQVSNGVAEEAAGCLLKAIEIAQKQQAKSLELRAVMSLVRLRQRQATHHGSRAKLNEAHQMLSEIYHWFTEEFDTKDLQEAKALVEELGL
jgi:predicted ATPase